MPYIYSTLPAPYDFAVYETGADNIAKPAQYIHINGGGQIAIPAGLGVDTPFSVETPITDENLALLKNDWTFRHFMEKGYIRIEDRKRGTEKVAGSMELPRMEEGSPMSERHVTEYEGEDFEVSSLDKPSRKNNDVNAYCIRL